MKMLRLIEILTIIASFILIVVGVVTAVRVDKEGTRHNKEMEQVLQGVQEILNNRKACIIVEPTK